MGWDIDVLQLHTTSLVAMYQRPTILDKIDT